MAKTNSNRAISVVLDPQLSAIHFYAMTDGNKNAVSHEQVGYRARLYSAEFFKSMTEIVSGYATKHPGAAESAITLVLPDGLIATDTVQIPTMRRKKMADALEIAVEGLYKNHAELQINSCPASQSKKKALYSLVIARKSILEQLVTACTAGQMPPQVVTYAAATAAHAVETLNPRLRSASYLLMDIQEESTRFVFVAKGRATGQYAIPFGYSVLEKPRLAAEDMLFDHAVADLVVLNAKEKARAKQLTMMQEDVIKGDLSELSEDEDGEIPTMSEPAPMEMPEDEDDEFAELSGAQAIPDRPIKTLPKKTPRKLPKFMLRPTPRDDQETAYENFRLFVKWALNLLQANERLKAQGEPETVYVNMPADFAPLVDTTNEEKDENRITFTLLDWRGERDEIVRHLEMYGGLSASSMNKIHLFCEKG